MEETSTQKGVYKMNASRKSIAWLGVLTALVLLVALFLPAPVFAQGPQPPTDPAAAERGFARMEKAYARLQEWNDKQAERLNGSDEFIARIEEKIAKLKERGLDTSAIEAALANYEAQLPTAQAAHDSAAATLAAHPGFDDNGKVTDPAAARETLSSASADLNACRQTLKDATMAIKDAFKDLRGQVRPDPNRP